MQTKTHFGVEWQCIGPCRIALADALLVMPLMGDGLADCAVTDPPYGIGADRNQQNRANMQGGAALAASADYGASDWDGQTPTQDAFDQLRRVSKHQVIWGGNYFTDKIPVSPSWIVWDKDNGTNRYADFELAWTSHKRAARRFRWKWHGMFQEGQPHDPNPFNRKEVRTHPTQKPVKLIEWVLREYTDDNDLIFDPYMGSGTTGVACLRTGRRFMGIEINPKYFEDAKHRLINELDLVRSSLIPHLSKKH